MRIIQTVFYALLAVSLYSCYGSATQPEPESNNKVMLLQVDYLTNEFEGGIELNFDVDTPAFTISYVLDEPMDLGSMKLFYEELNEMIFYGTIHWMGLGERIYPETLMSKDSFEMVLTSDYKLPKNGFHKVLDLPGLTNDVETPWASVQGLVKVREYLESNPEAQVNMYLYTPSVGEGDPADWDWYVIMKN